MSEKRMVDNLPVKKYSMKWCIEKGDHIAEDTQGEYIKLDELESVLQKLAQPKIITKAIKAYTFGGKLDLEQLLKE